MELFDSIPCFYNSSNQLFYSNLYYNLNTLSNQLYFIFLPIELTLVSILIFISLFGKIHGDFKFFILHWATFSLIMGIYNLYRKLFTENFIINISASFPTDGIFQLYPRL